MADVAVLVVNFDGGDWLPRCLGAVAAQQPPAAEVLVVDNASRDGSADALPAGVRLIRRATNGGYGAAIRDGLAASRSPFVLALNPDALLQPGCLAAAAAALEADPALGSVALRVLRADDPGRVDATAVGLTSRLGQLSRDGGRLVAQLDEAPETVLGPLGGAALYRRSALEAAGGYPAHYFLYWEDMHVALALLGAGFGCRSVPGARVHHAGGATIGHHSARNVFHMVANHWPCLIATLPAGTRRRLSGALLLAPLRAALLYAGRGRPFAALAGLLCGAARALAAWPSRPRQVDADADARLAALMAADDAHRALLRSASGGEP